MKFKMADKEDQDEQTIANDLVVTKYKMAAEMVNGTCARDTGGNAFSCLSAKVTVAFCQKLSRTRREVRTKGHAVTCHGATTPRSTSTREYFSSLSVVATKGMRCSCPLLE